MERKASSSSQSRHLQHLLPCKIRTQCHARILRRRRIILKCTSGEPASLANTIFSPSSTPAPPPARKRYPPGKRRSMGYIPRPNAFMLFCADFVKADLGIQYPEYKFLPVHNKNKDKTRKEEARVTMEDERRCSFCWRGRKGRSWLQLLGI